MNKFLFIVKNLTVSMCIILASSNHSFAHVNEVMEKWYKAPAVKLTQDLLDQRLKNISSEVDLRITKEVNKRIKEYTVLYPQSSEVILGKVNLYFPIFDKEIKKRNLPQELKYVAVVESLLNPMGTSKSGAAGLWQILKSTGRMLGLTVNGQLDERRDPIKSTEAALDYLEYLHDSFGDWTLAIAAYNCGPGNMRKAIRRSGGKRDFYELRNYLPAETRNYIPRFVAAAYLMNYYHLHNLTPNLPSQDFRFSSIVEGIEGMSFSKIEKQLDMPNGLMRKLNPSYASNIVPIETNVNTVVIPTSYLESYKLAFLPEEINELPITEFAPLDLANYEIVESQSVARDSMQHLEKLVATVIRIIHKDRKRYNIPTALRSNLSYLRA